MDWIGLGRLSRVFHHPQFQFEVGGLPSSSLSSAPQECLEAQTQVGCTAYFCGPVDHVGGQYADKGWGCGWRNIQMNVSHLLQRSEELRGALFAGCGFVPDIRA